MILRRLGNKKKMANKIIGHFPEHITYIEPFFGAGGMFFNKPKAKYNVLNDIDSEVFNLFWIVMDRPEELKNAFLKMPISEELWDHWRANQETDPIKKALRFLFLSRLWLYGKTPNPTIPQWKYQQNPIREYRADTSIPIWGRIYEYLFSQYFRQAQL